MSDEKQESFIEENYIYAGLGFPVRLAQVEMREFYGETVPVFDRKKVADSVAQLLCAQESEMTSAHLPFIRDYLQVTPGEFARLINKSEKDLQKWELSPEPVEMDKAVVNILKQEMQSQIANKKDKLESLSGSVATKGIFSHPQKPVPGVSLDVSDKDRMQLKKKY